MVTINKGALARIVRPDILRKKGVGYIVDQRGNQAKLEYRSTVFSKFPYVSETKIAFLNDIETLKDPLRLLEEGKFDDAWRFDLKQKAAYLVIVNRGGQLSNARTDLLPHQVFAANRVVSSPTRRFLLADEVGLGKTIEAGLVYYALKQRNQANRTLIITPAGLTIQWQEEMKDKFDEDFLVLKYDFLDANPRIWDLHDRCIASIDTLKRGDHKRKLLECQKWDMIIFDEAHKLSAKEYGEKTERTQNFQLANDLKDYASNLLLLTATPHQGDDSKFRNLLSLLYPSIQYPGESYLLGDGEGIRMEDVIIRNRKVEAIDAEGRPIFKGKETHPIRVPLLENGEKQFHRALTKYLIEGYGIADQDPTDPKRRAIGFVMTTFQKLAASSSTAIKKALTKRKQNLEGQLEPQEEVEYDARCEGEYETREVAKHAEPFIKNEIKLLEDLISLPVPDDAKKGELLRLSDALLKANKEEKLLIFTEYLNTQDYLKEVLEQKYGHGSVVIIRGQGMNLESKRKSQAEFRDNPRVRFLISTEAGGEGINLHYSCHIVVNYDLPWNPMRLDQRIGRLYRYGQDEVVQAYNFQNAGTIEDKVRAYLEQKMDRVSRALAPITGEDPEEIKSGLLGQMEEFINYAQIYRTAMKPGGIGISQKQIDEGIERAKEAYKIAFGALFKHDISRFNRDKYETEVKSPLTLEDLKEFVRLFVRNHKREFRRDKSGHYEFLTPDILKKHNPNLKKRYTNITFSREKASKVGYLDFIAFGHPVMEAIVEVAGDYDFGGLSAMRTITSETLKGFEGIQFNFVVKRVQILKDDEEVSFEIVPIMLDTQYRYNHSASEEALLRYGSARKTPSDQLEFAQSMDIQKAYEIARKQLEELLGSSMPWEEDITLLNVAWVAFV